MTKKFSLFTLLAVLPLAIVLVAALHGDRAAQAQETVSPNDVAKQLTGMGGDADRSIMASSHEMLDEGRRIFRYDTFGDEAFWGDTLRLHEAIAGSSNGGVGPRRQPEDRARRGPEGGLRRAAPLGRAGRSSPVRSSLDDPATTVALLRLNAVVGVTGGSPRAGRSSRSASSARSATPPSTIRSPPASVTASTDGRTATSTSARSSRCRPTSRPSTASSASTTRRRARSSRAGAPGSSTRSSSSTARRSGRTAGRPRRSSPPRSASRA